MEQTVADTVAWYRGHGWRHQSHCRQIVPPNAAVVAVTGVNGKPNVRNAPVNHLSSQRLAAPQRVTQERKDGKNGLETFNDLRNQFADRDGAMTIKQRRGIPSVKAASSMADFCEKGQAEYPGGIAHMHPSFKFNICWWLEDAGISADG